MQTTLDAPETIVTNGITKAAGAQLGDTTPVRREDMLRRFSGEARKTLDSKAQELESWVIAEARREADRRQEDHVSAWDVEIAVSRLREGTGSSLRETSHALGGVLLGVSLSSLTSIAFDLSSSITTALATIAGIMGGFMIAPGTWRKNP